MSTSLRCLQSSPLSPLRKAAISPIHNVRNLLYTFSRPLFPGLVQEKAEPEGDVKANGVVVRVFGELSFHCLTVTFPKCIFCSQNLNQQIQFTSHLNKVLLEPDFYPLLGLPRVATTSVHFVLNHQQRRTLPLSCTDININAQTQSQTYTSY